MHFRKHLTTVFIVVALYQTTELSAFGQNSLGSIAIAGRVSPGVSLQLAQTSQNVSSLAGTGGAGVAVRIRRPSDGSDVAVRFLARGNVDYLIVAQQLSALVQSGDLAVISVAEIQANAGGGNLATSALSVAIADERIQMNRSPAVILSGARVSRRGSNLTPDNALGIVFVVHLPTDVETADLNFQMLAKR